MVAGDSLLVLKRVCMVLDATIISRVKKFCRDTRPVTQWCYCVTGRSLGVRTRGEERIAKARVIVYRTT
eukprot:COSAG01_NODE_28766_length_653_cov_0.947653_1_plen_68_part_10